MEVLRIGRGPTPMLYYAATKLETDGAVMVTGSHNPPDYNGFKMMLGRQAVLRRADPASSARMARGRRRGGGGRGPRARRSTSPSDYVARLLARLGRRRPHAEGGVGQRQRRRGRGAAAAGRRPARRAHRAERRRSTARFPAHHPDPTVPTNLQQLIAEVRGAARRYRHRARWRRGPHRAGRRQGPHPVRRPALVLLARDVLREHPGATIIADVKASQVLFDEIARAGGNPLMWKHRAQPDQGEDGGDRLAARRRDVGPHLLRRSLVRLRRRAVRRGAHCSASWRAWTASCRRCATRCRR